MIHGAEAMGHYSCSSSGHTVRPVNITVTFVLSALGGFPVLPTAVLCWPSCQGFLVWQEGKAPFQKGRTGRKSTDHGSWGGQQAVVMAVQGSGSRELANGSEVGVGSRILSATLVEGSPR